MLEFEVPELPEENDAIRQGIAARLKRRAAKVASQRAQRDTVYASLGSLSPLLSPSHSPSTKLKGVFHDKTISVTSLHVPTGLPSPPADSPTMRPLTATYNHLVDTLSPAHSSSTGSLPSLPASKDSTPAPEIRLPGDTGTAVKMLETLEGKMTKEQVVSKLATLRAKRAELERWLDDIRKTSNRKSQDQSVSEASADVSTQVAAQGEIKAALPTTPQVDPTLTTNTTTSKEAVTVPPQLPTPVSPNSSSAQKRPHSADSRNGSEAKRPSISSAYPVDSPATPNSSDGRKDYFSTNTQSSQRVRSSSYSRRSPPPPSTSSSSQRRPFGAPQHVNRSAGYGPYSPTATDRFGDRYSGYLPAYGSKYSPPPYPRKASPPPRSPPPYHHHPYHRYDDYPRYGSYGRPESPGRYSYHDGAPYGGYRSYAPPIDRHSPPPTAPSAMRNGRWSGSSSSRRPFY